MTNLSTSLVESIIAEEYDKIPQRSLAAVVSKYIDGKTTNTIIESYLNEAKKKEFTFDEVVLEIRTLNKLDSVVENKLNFTLRDGSVIVLNKTMMSEMKKHLNGNDKAIEFMNESKENFMKIFKIIKENK